MKILLVGYHNPHFITITEYFERAVLSAGCSLESFDDRQFLIPGRIRDIVAPLQRWDLQRINTGLVATARAVRPDLCLAVGALRILPATIRQLHALGITTVLYTVDPPQDVSILLQAAPQYDYIFCGGTEAQALLEHAGVPRTRWLPFACDAELHRRQTLTDDEQHAYGTDVAFVGTIDPHMYPDRIALFESIHDLDLGLWGPGAANVPDTSPLRKNIRGGNVTPDVWTRIYSASKIALCSHFHIPSGASPCYQASPRVFEALACGAFLMVDRQKDVTALFKDGEHLVQFDNAADLREKILYYLAHPGERQRIAEAGHREVLEKHTYTHRLRAILSAMNEATK